ncbi:hypothetical protein [Galbibacter mesophilus]|uniref:hypothetical protein n=1 Tax=Galbibacter mesophilus TaxID=379069 RepID=UPI0019201666|nr:hypothetical protein [Galbibacter mesophilus]MCM5664001.1 hypothetical protein [Galbibacter mesophilus]
MKNFKLILVVLTLVFISCSKSDNNTDSYIYHFFKDKNLSIISNNETYIKYGEIDDGDNLVFEYRYTTQGEADIIDDEYFENIRFEIHSNLNEFNFTNEELITNSKIVLWKGCNCFFEYDPEKDILPTGTISGKRLSDTEWNISIDVTFYGNENRVINNTFKLKE